MRASEPFRQAHISTRDLPEKNRLATWREIYGRGIANVDIEPIGDEPFQADVTFNLLPNVSIAAGSRSPATTASWTRCWTPRHRASRRP